MSLLGPEARGYAGSPPNNDAELVEGGSAVIASAGGGGPATADRIRAMLDAYPDTMIGIHDRAFLAFGFAGAFRRSELVALQASDLEEVPDGYRVIIRRSKTDQTG